MFGSVYVYIVVSASIASIFVEICINIESETRKMWICDVFMYCHPLIKPTKPRVMKLKRTVFLFVCCCLLIYFLARHSTWAQMLFKFSPSLFLSVVHYAGIFPFIKNIIRFSKAIFWFRQIIKNATTSSPIHGINNFRLKHLLSAIFARQFMICNCIIYNDTGIHSHLM